MMCGRENEAQRKRSRLPEQAALFVDLAAVGYSCHVDCFGTVIDLVHRPVIANAYSPFRIAALSFLQPEDEESRPKLPGAALYERLP